MEPALKCGIIGAGNIAWRYDGGTWTGDAPTTHASCLDRHPKTELVAVYEPDISVREAFGATRPHEKHVILHDDLNSFLAQDLDVISVCSPSEHHYRHCLSAMRSGARFIWLEKPVTLDMQEYAALRQEWLKNYADVRISVNYFRRSLPQYRWLREVVQKHGPAHAIEIVYSRRADTNGVHMLDLLGALLLMDDAPDFACWPKGEDPNPSIGFCYGQTRITVTGIDLPYHCIDVRATLAEKRVSVIRGGLEAIEELRIENPDYPGFFHLDAARSVGDPELHRQAMRHGIYYNLCNLLDVPAPLDSSLLTAGFAQSILARLANAT